MALVIACILFGFMWLLPFLVRQGLERYVRDNSPYELRIGRLELHTDAAVLHEVELKPVLGKEAFARAVGFETDWIRVNTRTIRIKGLSWITLFRNRLKNVHRIEIEDADIYVYRDKRLKDPEQYRPLPQALLRGSALRFTVPELSLNGKVIYEEIHPANGRPVLVSFDRLSAVIRNLTSDNVRMEQHPDMQVEASAFFLDSVETHLYASLSLTDTHDRFNVKGHTGSFSATHLNRCLEPATGARIRSGNVRRISFRFTADNDLARGKLDIDYSDLKLELKEDGKQHGLKTLLANMLVNNRDKKEQNGSYTGEIFFKRRKDRFIFNYWWHAFKTGVVSSVLKEPAEKLVKDKIRK